MLSKATKFSLKENVRLRLLKDMVSGIKLNFPNVPNFILVLDPSTTKIVSSCIKMIEFLEEGVITIERLELSRKQFPKSHAIYFVAPTHDSIDSILKDFSNPKDPQYGNVHLYFTNHIHDDLVTRMSTQKNFIERVLTFKELNLDFLCPENNVFHFDMQETFPKIFDDVGNQELEKRIAFKLSTVVPTLFDFEKFHIIYNKNPRNVIAEKVSKFLRDRIEKFVESKKKQLDNNPEPAAPVKIVVLDRSFDPLTPLLHDYYYHGLVYDLLDVKSDIVEYQTEDNSGKVGRKKAVLSDSDELWSKYRGQFIGEAMINISKEFEEFVANNRTAQTKKTDMSNLNLEQMSAIVKSMPMYQEVLGKYTLHISLIQECVKIFNDQGLKEIGDLEQSIATGVDGEGKSLSSSKLFGLISQKLAQGNISDQMKLRLLMITTIALELADKERKTLAQQLSGEDKSILSKLNWLGVDPTDIDSSKKKASSKSQTGASLAAKTKLKNISTDLLRHTSELEKIATDVVGGVQLSSMYGNLYIPSSYDGGAGKGKLGGPGLGTTTIGSLRKGAKPVNTNWSSDSKDERVQPKYIFFVIGGMSYSEIRVLNEIERRNPNVTIMIGATAFMKPSDYIDGIAKLQNP